MKTNVLEPPEPKDKLDAETVNGPEDETPDWDTIVWPVHEENVRVPAGPKLSGRDLGHPRHGLREKPAAPMDSGR